MNYAGARKEILEKYQGEEEQKALALYEGWYIDQKRIQTEREQAAKENVFQRLQTFTSAEEAMAYALKNAKSISGYDDMRRFIKDKFNPQPTETKEGALTEFKNDLERGKFDALTLNEAKVKLGPNFSMDDWDKIVKPALERRRTDNKDNRTIVNRVISSKITDMRKDNENKFGIVAADRIERAYERAWEEKPDMKSEEAVKAYKEASASETLKVFWGHDKRISEVEKREIEAKGYRWSPEKRQWLAPNEPDETDEKFDFDRAWGGPM
jgi:hypothetical protein